MALDQNNKTENMVTPNNLSVLFQVSSKLIGKILLVNIVIIILYSFYDKIDFFRYFVDITLLEGAILFIISPLFLSFDLSSVAREDRIKKKRVKHSELMNELKIIEQKSPKMIIRTKNGSIEDIKPNDSSETKRKSNYYGKIGFISALLLLVCASIFDFLFVNLK